MSFKRPAQVPRWAWGAATLVQPPSGSAEVGFATRDEPPAQWFNWPKQPLRLWADETRSEEEPAGLADSSGRPSFVELSAEGGEAGGDGFHCQSARDPGGVLSNAAAAGRSVAVATTLEIVKSVTPRLTGPSTRRRQVPMLLALPSMTRTVLPDLNAATALASIDRTESTPPTV